MLTFFLMGDGKASENNSTANYDGHQVILDSEGIAAHGDGFDGEESRKLSILYAFPVLIVNSVYYSGP